MKEKSLLPFIVQKSASVLSKRTCSISVTAAPETQTQRLGFCNLIMDYDGY